ncbi:hypothetical protein ARAM_000309 [Aspergillus rambellii]|uniref:Wings apart-like protein C-terminal domain-containing protein n=1 Tax=Aspergillus rambellii TaxID=308745 RepID=A0A0F8XT83_9EURO|nr:hypothetical protein ARAM_000309 [Aspergillus rambellii]
MALPANENQGKSDTRDQRTFIKQNSHRATNQNTLDIPDFCGGPDKATKQKPLNAVTPTYSRSFRRQEPSIQLEMSSVLSPNREHKKHGATVPQRRIENASPRKRLVDSLGTMDEQLDSPLLQRGNGFEQDRSLHRRLGHEIDSNFRSALESSPESEVRTAEQLEGQPAASIPPKLQSSKVTYSRQRSFLNDASSIPEMESHGIQTSSICETSTGARHSLTSHLSREEDENSNSKAVRSIHELRQAGDNARFRETIDSIFEDIEDTYNSASGRCCGFAQLCLRLSEPQFVRRFSEEGFEERLAKCTQDGLDIISTSLALGAYKLILANGPSSHILAGSLWPQILHLSLSVLDTEDGILYLAKEPRLGMSKTAQASVRSLQPHFLSVVDVSPPNISPCILALECIMASLLDFRKNGSPIQTFPASLLGRLVDLVVLKTPKESDFPLSPHRFHMLELIFSVLENYSIISGPLDYEHRLHFQRLSGLHTVFTPNPYDQSRQIIISYIRVILNVTNKEPSFCDDFATPELVSGLAGIVVTEFRQISSHSSAKESNTLNTVILALGTLINLAENTELSRAIFLQSDGVSDSFLKQLLMQFSDSVRSMDQANSVSEVHQNVVAGYLSILLLTICLDVEARRCVKAALDGNGLTSILSTAEKFLQYHQKVERDSHAFESRDEGESRLTARLGHIIDQIRQSEEPS